MALRTAASISYSEVINKGIACSSMLIGNIGAAYCTWERNTEPATWKEFVETLSHRANSSMNQYSVVCISTIRDQDIAEKYLERFGFVPSKAVENAKNGTICTFWVLDIPTFYGTLTKECKELNLPAPKKCFSSLA